MTIEEMHFDFKMKLNKVDNQENRNLLIPEIDWILNEAQELFVKMIAKPRLRSNLGFEKSQRIIDDIKNIVINDYNLKVVENKVALPDDYWHFLSGEVIIEKGSCKNVKAKFHLRQHDDDFENSPFDKSSFIWRTVNGVFYKDGIKLFTDGTFQIKDFHFNYIKKLKYIHNAKNYKNQQYKLPSGVMLKGKVDCELSEQTHREIVDLAVLLASTQLESQSYQIHNNKINLNLK